MSAILQRIGTNLVGKPDAASFLSPQALFSDFQWFLFETRDAVYFTAFSKVAFDKDTIGNVVAEMVALAPQLTHGFVGARPGQPFPKHLLDAITDIQMVDSFDGYPDKWLGHSQDIFERTDLPLFRVQAAVRRGGPDAEGRASVLQVRVRRPRFVAHLAGGERVKPCSSGATNGARNGQVSASNGNRFRS